MSKNITSSLLTGIQSPVATLAICMELKRDDGDFIRLTNHDEDLVIGGNTYRSDVPFVLSAVDGGSSLNSDTADIEVAVDEITFTSAEIRFDGFKNAEVELFEVDYSNLAAGKMTIRKGWIAKVETNKNKVATFEVNGLLKILDFSVGRIFQPSCDADLGDRRCRVAIDLGQSYSFLNRYEVGDWVYHYPEGSMNAVTIVNPSFGVDGARSEVQTITGWTKGPSSTWVVNSVSPYQSGLAAHASATDIFFLEAYPDVDAEGEETYVYQDINLLTATTMLAADIDDGQIVFGLFTYFQQTVYFLDKPRVVLEITDATGELIERIDTDYFDADTIEEWRERSLVFSLLPGSRFIRVYLYAMRNDADVPNVVFDEVTAGWWNHTVATPYADVIHKVSRIMNTTAGYLDYVVPNGSFELDGAVANSSTQNISRWLKATGDYWQVATTVAGQPAQDGTYMLVGGDDGTGVQQTYAISQTFLMTATGLAASRIALGKVAGRCDLYVVFGDTTSEAELEITFVDALDVDISSVTAFSFYNPGSVGYQLRRTGFSVPPLTAKIRTTLRAKSPVGSSVANIGFDGIEFFFVDAERPDRKDPVFSKSLQYNPATTFSQVAGTYTVDERLVWKAHSTHLQYDVVATVTDRKNFRATAMTGAEGAFETGLIRWISGDNAGSKNIIRVWDSVDKDVRLYFPTVHPIQVGDRFTYVRPCQKRFLEDCFTRFDNAINFQGFPYLPSTTTG